MISRVFLVICVLSLSLGQYSTVFSIGDSKLYAFDLLIPLFGFYGLIYLLVVRRSFHIHKYFVPFLVFLCLALLSLIINAGKYSFDQVLLASFYLIRFASIYFSGIVLYNLILCGDVTLDFVRKLLFLSVVLISVAGFLQLFLLPDFESLDSSLGWDPHKNRLASTFFDPNFVGGYIVFCSIFLLILGTRPYKLLIPLVALLATFSRSSWAFAAIAVFVYGIFKSKKLLLLSFLLGFLVYFAVPRVQTRISGITDPSDSASFRLISWKNTMKIARDNLLYGVGFNTFRYVQQDYGYVNVGEFGGHSGSGSDSSFLLVLATTGIVGVATFSVSYITPVIDAFVKKDILVVALFLGLFVHSQFVNSLFYPQIMFAWMMFLGVYSASFSYTKE